MKSNKMRIWMPMSVIALLVTGPVYAGSSMTNSLKSYTGTSTNAATISALEVDGLLMTDTNAASRAILFDGNGATYPTAVANNDANYISTVENYAGQSFVAEVDIVVTEEPAYSSVFFMGIGTGIPAGEWGLPDLGTSADTIFIENNGGWYSGVWRQESGSAAEKLTPENEENRWWGLASSHATVTYNAASDMVTFEIVRDDDIINFGPFSTAGMYAVEPSRVFFGGKKMILSNFEVALPEDVTAPTPDPSFATAPIATGDNKISMTSTTVVDDLSGVEYYFTCTAGGGQDSGWQTSTNYVDTGLIPDTEYTYTVTARDTSSNMNDTDPSLAVSATTDVADVAPPSPETMTFAIAPIALAPTAISMKATSAADSSGVEYFFTCTAGGGNDSGWQDSPTYVDSGLTDETEYSYTVIARDLSYSQNSNTVSAAVSITTPAVQLWMVNSLTDYIGDTTQQVTRIALGADSLEYGTPSATAVISFDGSGATFGEGTDYHGRNILRTIGQTYDDVSFEAYATFVFNGAPDQAAFMGLGNGIIDADVSGNYGVPELALSGVNGLLAEMKTSLSAGAQNVSLLKINNGSIVTNYVTDPLATIDTFRVKLAYDADAETATLSADTGYTGGEFEEDRVLGTVDTSGSGGANMWFGSPVRVYVGGGEGTVVSDLLIVANLPADQAVHSGIADVAGSGMKLSWEGLAGQIYDVQYKTDLINDSWAADPSSGCSDIFVTVSGVTSATSTVPASAAFYQVIRQ